jgi:hypothetical protein
MLLIVSKDDSNFSAIIDTYYQLANLTNLENLPKVKAFDFNFFFLDMLVLFKIF